TSARIPAFSQERLKRRRATSKGSFSFSFTDGIGIPVRVTDSWGACFQPGIFRRAGSRAPIQGALIIYTSPPEINFTPTGRWGSGPLSCPLLIIQRFDSTMRVLGIESSCDETGVALYDSERGLLSHKLYSQVALHADYGG